MVNLRKPLAEWIVTSPFGERIHPITHNLQFHNGVDLRANEGSSIFAPGRSIVEKKYVNSVGGKQIILFHPDQNLYTGYAHLPNKPKCYNTRLVTRFCTARVLLKIQTWKWQIL